MPHTKKTEAVFSTLKESDIPRSAYPDNFIPKKAKAFVSIDFAEGGDCQANCIVRGFYDPSTGEYHIQSIEDMPSCSSK